jgi:hypothetical protein
LSGAGGTRGGSARAVAAAPGRPSSARPGEDLGIQPKPKEKKEPKRRAKDRAAALPECFHPNPPDILNFHNICHYYPQTKGLQLPKIEYP